MRLKVDDINPAMLTRMKMLVTLGELKHLYHLSPDEIASATETPLAGTYVHVPHPVFN